jgi:DNA polymerase III alpha subunit
MKKNKFGELVFDQNDLCDLMMKNHDVTAMRQVTVDPGVDLASLIESLENPGHLKTWNLPQPDSMSVEQFDLTKQSNWKMPQEYREFDIAEHVLSLCKTPEQLQRAGQELLLFQERGLFDLLRYLRYLVDVMTQHQVIWGAGRGSSVASYVLYLLGVHRIDSMFYDLDPEEFLR